MPKVKNNVYHEKGANLSLIKIDSVHCWRCGEQFQSNQKGMKKTKHHAIPQEMNPVRNITIPICENCHKEIHQDSQAMNPKKVRVLKRVESMKKHYKSIDENFDKIIKDLKENGNSDG